MYTFGWRNAVISWVTHFTVDVFSRNGSDPRRLGLVSLLVLQFTAEPNEGLVSLQFTIHSG